MKSFFSVVLLFVSVFTPLAYASLNFEEARVYLPLKGRTMTAAYATIRGAGKITGVKAEGFQAAEIHASVVKDGRTLMQKLDEIEIKKGENPAVLKPGGMHIMLFDPVREFKDGEKIQLTFTVDGQALKVPFKMIPRTP